MIRVLGIIAIYGMGFASACGNHVSATKDEAVESRELREFVDLRIGDVRSGCIAGDITMCERLGFEAKVFWDRGVEPTHGTHNEVAMLLRNARIWDVLELVEDRCTDGDATACNIRRSFGKTAWSSGLTPGYGDALGTFLDGENLKSAQDRSERKDMAACRDLLAHHWFVGTKDTSWLTDVVRRERLSVCEAKGICVWAAALSSSRKDACRLLEHGCESGHLNSCAWFGGCLEEGWRGGSLELARKHYRAACHGSGVLYTPLRSNSYGCFRLALLEEEVAVRNYLLRAACMRGSARACVELGHAAGLSEHGRLIAYGAACNLGRRAGCVHVECVLSRKDLPSPEWYAETHFRQPCATAAVAEASDLVARASGHAGISRADGP